MSAFTGNFKVRAWSSHEMEDLLPRRIGGIRLRNGDAR